MAVAIDASSVFVSSNSATATITTGTISPPAGSRLWAFCHTDNGLGGFACSFSSSPALTWTTVEDTSSLTTGPVAVAWANITVGWSGTVTGNYGATITNGVGLAVLVVTGGETTPGGVHHQYDSVSSWSRVNGTGITNCAIVASATGSIVVAGTTGVSGSADWTAPAGQTELASYFYSLNWQGSVWRVDGTTTSGNTYTPNLTQTGSNELGGMVSVEIRAAAGGGPAARSNWGTVSI